MEGPTFSWNDFELTDENRTIYKRLKQCIEKRKAYQHKALQVHSEAVYSTIYESFSFGADGVYTLYDEKGPHVFVPTVHEYFQDSEFVINTANHRPTKSLCFRRLENLKHNFLMYKNLSAEREKSEQKAFSQKDFYTVVKIDTHVHHSACMNSKHLLKFIKKKLLNKPDEVVYEADGRQFTLKEVFDNLSISVDNLCIDTLDTHAHTDTFHRFDRFNAKYNPYGQPVLREIFLKHENALNGKYLSQITREVINTLEESKYLYCEYRISIYGKSKSEWDTLSNWVVKNNIRSEHVKWLIQIPRLFTILVDNRSVSSFGEMLVNIFEPLFVVSKDRSVNPILAKFLDNVVGFDCVDDESLKERRYHKKFPLPNEWSHRENPPFAYYIYFLYANIASLNHYRRSKGQSTFSFRPHAGETGDYEHLAYTFLTAQGVSHGVQLRKSLPLQYLYYVCRIGIAMSPLSNNSLFLSLDKSPFPDFFKKGLNISVSTDDPLQFHFTKEPLMEEYSIVSQIWKLSSTDQCELARNSVLQSNFPLAKKKEWIGDDFMKDDHESNDIRKTNIANLRAQFRHYVLSTELILLNKP